MVRVVEIRVVIVLLALLFSAHSFCAEVYKYKGPNGNWIFSDKPPVEKNKAEKIIYKGKAKTARPAIYGSRKDGWNYIIADNPYHAPVEFRLHDPSFEGGSQRHLVSGAKREILFKSQTTPKFRYNWEIGDPSITEIPYVYSIPVTSKSTHKITQSFSGKFSHSEQPNLYAVDVAMPVGTSISAARAGTVIWVKDDYHMSGRGQYFLDKANYVAVLHEDGTYAVYAHLLLGSATVKPGQQVEVGDILGRSGSSGYSTGPHLHFVIQRNIGAKTVSIPFQFTDHKGLAFTPKRGMKINGLR